MAPGIACGVIGEHVRCWPREAGRAAGLEGVPIPVDHPERVYGGETICVRDRQGGGACFVRPARGPDDPQRLPYAWSDAAHVAAGTPPAIVTRTGGIADVPSSDDAYRWQRIAERPDEASAPVELAPIDGVSGVEEAERTSALLCWRDADGHLACRGDRAFDLDASDRVASIADVTADDVADLAIGVGTACLLTRSGAVRCWGLNDVGQATGAQPESTAVTRIAGVDHALAMVVHADLACELEQDGGVRCWGAQIGFGDEEPGYGWQRSAASAVTGLPPARALVLLDDAPLVLAEDGSVIGFHVVERDGVLTATQRPALDGMRADRLVGGPRARLAVRFAEHGWYQVMPPASDPFAIILAGVTAPAPEWLPGHVRTAASSLPPEPRLSDRAMQRLRCSVADDARVRVTGRYVVVEGPSGACLDCGESAGCDATIENVERLVEDEGQLCFRRAGAWLCSGHNGVGQLGLTPSRPISEPTPVPAIPAETTGIAFAHHQSCFWGDASGELRCAGLDPETLTPRERDARGDGSLVVIPGVRGTTQVALGSVGASCAVVEDGAVYCWGRSASPLRAGDVPRFVDRPERAIAMPSSAE